MKNIRELREELNVVFTQVRDEQIDLRNAKELNNTAGKIVATLRAQLEYAKMRKEKPQINYLKCR